jgi:hypothetical protein
MKKHSLIPTLIAVLQFQAKSINALPPIPFSCANNVGFEFQEDGGRTLSCTDIESDESTRIISCQTKAVRNNCPRSCGLCCEDNELFQFQTKNGNTKDCQWLGERDIRSFLYCNEIDEGTEKAISDSCPKTCNVCKPFVQNNIPEYILESMISSKETETSSPTSLPPPTSTCKDDPDFFLFDRLSCVGIQKNEYNRQKFCSTKEEVRKACPVTCGLCCSDDDSYTFTKPNLEDELSCSDLVDSEFNQIKYCDRFRNDIMVKNACRRSCNNCMTKVDIAPGTEVVVEKPGVSASTQEGLTTQTSKMPLYLGLAISFLVIGVLLALYSVYSSRKAKRQEEIHYVIDDNNKSTADRNYNKNINRDFEVEDDHDVENSNKAINCVDTMCCVDTRF